MKNRITIPLGELHARVKAAAEKARQSMTQWILTAIEQRLKEGTK